MRFPSSLAWSLTVLAICLVFTKASSSAPTSQEEEPLLDKNSNLQPYLSSSASFHQKDESLERNPNAPPNLIVTSEELDQQTPSSEFLSMLPTEFKENCSSHPLNCLYSSKYLKRCRKGSVTAGKQFLNVDPKTRSEGLRLAYLNGHHDVVVRLLAMETDQNIIDVEKAREILFLEDCESGKGDYIDAYIVYVGQEQREEGLEKLYKSGRLVDMDTVLQYHIAEDRTAGEVGRRLFMKACGTDEEARPVWNRAYQHRDYVIFESLVRKVDSKARTDGFFLASDMENAALVDRLLQYQYGGFDEERRSEIDERKKLLFLEACKTGKSDLFFALLARVDPATRTQGLLNVWESGHEEFESRLVDQIELDIFRAKRDLTQRRANKDSSKFGNMEEFQLRLLKEIEFNIFIAKRMLIERTNRGPAYKQILFLNNVGKR